MAPSIDEFEDLTQFADESFDTEEVDLFEFSDDEDSPLIRLKSIVLSLDWEITEETLSDLGAELANLRDMWRDDKVAQIYLQGMENVGKYLRSEGAYAHPNAIKLLLTLYSNFEKIISSPDIDNAAVTVMVKADIRKFKVLQYQIGMSKGGGAEPAADSGGEPVLRPAEQKKGASPLHSMEATILGLEWEVTDEGLGKFHDEASKLRQELSGNAEAQVLIQGLQALGAYIRQQKSEAHPDAFTILHSFYDALKSLLEHKNLTAEQRRQMLVEQIGSLNSLKEVIARSAAGGQSVEVEAETEEMPLDGEEEADEAVSSSAEAEEADLNLDRLFSGGETEEDSGPASSWRPPAPEPPAAAVGSRSSSRPSAPAADEEDDEELDALFPGAEEGGAVTPALADEDETGGFSGSPVVASISDERAAELNEKLNSFFDLEDDVAALKPKPAESAKGGSVSAPPAAAGAKIDADGDEEGEIGAGSDDELDSFFNFDEEETWDDSQAAAAEVKEFAPELRVDNVLHLAEEEDAQEDAAEEGEIGAESDDELDSFFNFDEDEAWDSQTAAAAEVKEFAPELRVDNDAPLAEEEDAQEDAPEESGSGIGSNDELDSFLSFDKDETPWKAKVVAAEPDAGLNSGDSAFSPALDDDAPGIGEEAGVAALADADEDDHDGISFADEEAVGGIEPERQAEINEKLDSFFNFEDGLDLAVGEKEKEDAAAGASVEDALPGAAPAAAADDDEPAPGGFSAPAEVDGDLAANDVADSLFDFANANNSGGSGPASEQDMQDLDDEFITALDEQGGDEDEAGGVLAAEEESFIDSIADAPLDHQGRTAADDEFDAFFAPEGGSLGSSADDDENELPVPYAAAEEDEFAVFFGEDAPGGTQDEAESAAFEEDEEDELPAAEARQEKALSSFLDQEEDDFPASQPAPPDEEQDDLFHFDADAALMADAPPAAAASSAEKDDDELFGLDEEFVLTAADEDEPSAAPEEDDAVDVEEEAFGFAAEESGGECPVVDAEPFDDSREDIFEETMEAEAADNADALADEHRSEDALSSLVAAAAVLSAAPSAAVLHQVAELAAEAKAADNIPPHQAIVLNLIDSSASLIAKAPEADGSAIVQELAAGLKRAENPYALAELISRYTGWQQDFFAKIIAQREDGAAAGGAELHQLQEGVSNLREDIMAEFSQLRKELKTAIGSQN